MAEIAIRSLVPMAHVASVARSMEFYARLGFAVRDTFSPPGAGEPAWAYLFTEGGAQLMVSLASEPVVPGQQAVLFYIYCDDVAGMRERLLGEGVEVSEINYPFYNRGGEFRTYDPDGYVIYVTHL